MGKLLTIVTLAVLATPAAYGQNGNNNGARVGKAGFLLNVLAFDECPAADFTGSQRRAIAVQADHTGNATDKATRANKIFVRAGGAFHVQDGNACDQTGAYLELPVTARNCANCGGALRAPTFVEYEVRTRVRGKPGGKSAITGCVEMLELDARTETEIATSFCSVGDESVWVGTRDAGGGTVPNRWRNASTQLLTVCVDTSGDGVCDDRVGLFDSIGEDYWWSFDNAGRPHVQLVFFPVRPGSGTSAEPPPEPTPDPTPDPGPILK
jgi:hypothetical protein